MTERRGPDAEQPRELSEEQLAEAAGGFTPHPDPPKVAAPAQRPNIGSQSTGAGAGKVTFNPF